MENNLSQDNEKLLNELAEAVQTELANGKSKQLIVDEFVKQGWDRERAVQFVDKADAESGLSSELRSFQSMQHYDQAEKYRKKMIWGGVALVLGTLITVVGYSAASSGSGGGRYFIFYGPIIWGLISLVQGYNGWSKYR